MRKRVLKVMLLFIMLFPAFVIKLNCDNNDEPVPIFQKGTWLYYPGVTRPICDCTDTGGDCFCITV